MEVVIHSYSPFFTPKFLTSRPSVNCGLSEPSFEQPGADLNANILITLADSP